MECEFPSLIGSERRIAFIPDFPDNAVGTVGPMGTFVPVSSKPSQWVVVQMREELSKSEKAIEWKQKLKDRYDADVEISECPDGDCNTLCHEITGFWMDEQ